MKSVQKLGWCPELPSIKDWRFRESGLFTKRLLSESPDRRALNQNAPVFDQRNLGSCVGCSAAYGVDFLRRSDRDVLSTEYSQLQLYYDARVRDDPGWAKIDSGAYIRDVMDCLRTIGVAPYGKWPYTKPFDKKPTPSVYKEATRWKLGAHWRCETIDDMMAALAAGCALVGGIVVYPSMINAVSGRVPMPSPGEKMLGGHALYFDRYTKSDKLFRFQNSWGTSWGDGGYGTIPFDYLASRDLADDFWAMQTESPETTPWKD